MYRKIFLILLLGIGFANPAMAGLMPKDAGDQYELSFWESVRNSRYAGDYDAYLQAYPNGRFAGLARARVDRLRGGKAKPTVSYRQQREAARTAARQSTEAAVPLQPGSQPNIPAAAAATAALTELEIAAATAGSVSVPLARVTALEMSDCTTCPTLVALADGGFRMGSNTEDPVEQPASHVFINKPFAIGKYEITLGQWNACITDGVCARVSGDASLALNTPVRNISWDDAQRYIGWLSKLSGVKYRLPSEAEWEFAARGGSASRYWWGEKMMTGVANCKDCGLPWSDQGPVTVGSFVANGFGLHDMVGSVREWVSDCWHDSYKGAPSNGTSWEQPNCQERVLRGGSWRDGASQMPVTKRFKAEANARQAENGFRIARNLD